MAKVARHGVRFGFAASATNQQSPSFGVPVHWREQSPFDFRVCYQKPISQQLSRIVLPLPM
jgi:hypothetical protein